jgi:hypothetical protein
MKTLIALVSFALLPWGGMADVSKEEVKKLLQAGLTEDVILKYVGQHAPMAKLTPEDIADLKNAGASDSLLKGLMDASTAKAAPPADQSPTYSAPQETYNYYNYDSYNYEYPNYYPYYPYFSYYYYPYRYHYPYSYPYYSNRVFPRHHSVPRPYHR